MDELDSWIGPWSNLAAASELKSASLPSDQWKVEVLNWHNISMATAQRAVLDWVTGQYEAAYNRFVEHPTMPEGSNMCLNQKTRSSGYHNFSLAGVLIILTVGMFIVCLNLSLPRLIDWLSRRRHKGEHARRAWVMDETLQLHWMAFEGRSLGLGPARTVAYLSHCLERSSCGHMIMIMGLWSTVYSGVALTETTTSAARDEIMVFFVEF